MRKLVAGVDGSEASLAALDWAVAEAVRHGVGVRIVYAPLWEPYERTWPEFGTARPRGRSVAEHILVTAGERARERGPEVPVEAEPLSGDPVPALLREADEGTVLVVGDRGRGGHDALPLGSVALTVAARAACPVVVVRGGAPARRGEFGRIVLGTGHDGAEPAAVDFAFREARARGCAVTAVHSWRSPERGVATHAHTLGGAPDPRMREAEWALDRAVRAAAQRRPDVPLERQTPEGLARDTLLAAAAAADLVVLGARRTPAADATAAAGATGIQLGPASHGVLHLAPCPVAVVREG
ncbi:universal stress protein [Streptomyces sp. MAR4 CNX-425]|uniref:universal stress protein n=1 Tax=Streptomyces sp. MAR4 CNX-425 TaxID=3406343 RepID=UPI003B513F44